MNNHDNGFDKAQREYDNQLPPEGDTMDECPDCEGEGILDTSNCCDAPVLESDICSHCKEHCDYAKCDTCDGEGEINVSEQQRQEYEDYLERKAEEAEWDRLSRLDHLL